MPARVSTPSTTLSRLRTGRTLREALCVELGSALRPAGNEANDRPPDPDLAVAGLDAEQLPERSCLRGGIVGPELKLGELELVLADEKFVDPVPRRMHLEPEAGVRRDEGTPPRVLLDAQALGVGAGKDVGEVVLVEHHAE